ncbi:unnamed protein product [Adineta ricciae]|uniref:G-protein coupled receptors family 1 profile domain-containing protein n=1 Tax=Adineta ricciae TaxID=249248 RepID=A0A814TU58_ADIRI|nr:unnamed protein product [Adineta ricciae]CAF1165898.1 unnamed protein product [Adineta ricciae]
MDPLEQPYLHLHFPALFRSAIILFYQGKVAFSSDRFCAYWYVLTSFLNMSSVQLNAYLSIERYFLIFHNPFLIKHKIIVHYIPMVTFIVMPFVYVVYVVNFMPCVNHFDYHSWACGTACYLTHPVTGTFSWVFAIIAPLIVMIISNTFLIARVLYFKKRMMQRRIWYKNRKMLLQLLSLVGMLYISWMPSGITSIINNYYPTSISMELTFNWTLICFIYVATLFSPLTTILAIPELKEEIFRSLNQWTKPKTSARIIPAA